MGSLYMLNPFKYKLFSLQLFSHKLCRWLVPFALLLLLVSNVVLIFRSPVYTISFVLQLSIYVVAFVGIKSDVSGPCLVKLPAFFVMVNLSILKAWCRYLRGERALSWQPTNR